MTTVYFIFKLPNYSASTGDGDLTVDHLVTAASTTMCLPRLTSRLLLLQEQKQLAIPGQPPSTAQQLQGDQRQKTESDEQARGKCHVQDNMSASTDHQDSIPADNSPTPQEKKCADVQMDSKQSEHVPVVASVSDGPPTMKASVDVNSVPEGNDRLSSGRRGQAPGGGRVKVYFHAISDQQESLLKVVGENGDTEVWKYNRLGTISVEYTEGSTKKDRNDSVSRHEDTAPSVNSARVDETNTHTIVLGRL
ncbi:hypothetical protein C0Q70_18336 [Pomacea canaliculata]|uniref:Uncharacterized protein n=1 Tax=Pomacea canaliculata TaxID=400727 RepID=A0A2T7NMY8_POMCA|nr:hypothetical protein C0Q70_18336 [Pomacea canaliculata]